MWGELQKCAAVQKVGASPPSAYILIPVEVLQFLSRNILRPLLEYSVCLKGILGSWRHLYKKHVHKSSWVGRALKLSPMHLLVGATRHLLAWGDSAQTAFFRQCLLQIVQNAQCVWLAGILGSWCHSAEKCKSLCGRRPESLPSAENERVAAFSLQFGPIDRYIECNSRMLKYIALAPKKCAFVMCCKALALSSTRKCKFLCGEGCKSVQQCRKWVPRHLQLKF